MYAGGCGGLDGGATLMTNKLPLPTLRGLRKTAYRNHLTCLSPDGNAGLHAALQAPLRWLTHGVVSMSVLSRFTTTAHASNRAAGGQRRGAGEPAP
jgi:hypothetical protein